MSTPARRRMYMDYKQYMKEGAGMGNLELNHALGIFLQISANDYMKWEAVILGPDDTEWEGGVFNLKMEFGEDYPTKPPKVSFLTKMYHPNIYQTGEICLDILQKEWT